MQNPLIKTGIECVPVTAYPRRIGRKGAGLPLTHRAVQCVVGITLIRRLFVVVVTFASLRLIIGRKVIEFDKPSFLSTIE